MMNEPLVSIIIPCYNYGSFLKETLENITHQTYKNWECIVVDDGSKDQTKQVAEAFVNADKRFQYVYQENAGVSVARNTGMAKAKGKYFQFIDADDLLSPSKLELQVPFLEENKEVDIIYSSSIFFETENPSVYRLVYDSSGGEWQAKVSGKGDEVLNVLIVKNIMVMHAPLLRRKVVDRVGEFDPGLKGMEDWDYWIRCALKRCFFQFDEREATQVKVRLHPTSASKNNNTMLTGEILMRKKLQRFFSKNPEFKKYSVINKEYLHQCSSRAAFGEIHHGSLLTGWRKVFIGIGNSGKPMYYFKNALYWQLRRFRFKQ